MAWSRPEKWIGWGFALILITTVLSVLLAVRDWRIHRMVRADFRVIEEACRLYRNTYERWPIRKDVFSDVRYGDQADQPNLLVMNALRSVDAPGNPGFTANPQKKVFLDLRPASRRLSGRSPEGAFLDPWGSSYQIIFDVNGDNTCDLPDVRFGSAVNTLVAVWSFGPDRRPDTLDDLTSWEQ